MMEKRKYNNLFRFLKLVFKNKVNSAIALVLVILTSCLAIWLPTIMKDIVDVAIKQKNCNKLISFSILYVIISIINTLGEFCLSFLYSRMQKKLMIDLNLSVLKHLTKLPGKLYNEMKTGEILTVLDGDVWKVESIGAKFIFTLMSNVLTALIAVGYLLKMQPDLLVIVLVIQIMTVFMQIKFNAVIVKKMSSIRDTAGQISQKLQEFVSSIVSILMIKGTKLFFRTYIDKEKEYIHQGIALDSIISGSILSVRLFDNLLRILIYGYGGYKVITGKMTIGELIAYNTYAEMFVYPLMSVFEARSTIQQSVVSLDRIYGVLDLPVDSGYIEKGRFDFGKDNCNINFKDVSFAYNEDKEETLKEINIDLEPNKVYALVGYSGSGKSTIVKLLYRLWKTQKGSISINGVGIEQYNLAFLRKNITVVAQDVFLFDDTILNNITLGATDISKEKVIEICKKVEIYDFIQGLPQKFDTIVGEKGVKISGGQKQRISIARALLRDTKVLIFDEATSALDNITENKIFSNIQNMFDDKIVIMIAHRLTTIHNADKIYVFKNGRIVESGRHNVLLKNNGEYFRFNQVVGTAGE